MTRVLALVAVLAAAAATPAGAQNAEIASLWRGGIASAGELLRHPSLVPVLDRILGARIAAYRAATARPGALTRHMGKILVGTGCAAAGCAAGGAFVVADTQRGEVLVVLAAPERTAPDRAGPRRFERFATAGFPMESESVAKALAAWQERFGSR